MNVALVHDLPTGGALRVAVEWLRRTSADAVTVYCRDAAVHDFAPLPGGTPVVALPRAGRAGPVGDLQRLLASPAAGRALAARVDAGGHDVAFCLPSVLTQAPDVLPWLGTPHVHYAPEPLRSAHEPPELVWPGGTLRETVTRHGLNPIELRRRRLDRRYMAAAERVVTHSRFTAGTLHAAYGVDAGVVPLGVDAEAFTPGGVDGAGERYVLAVGALHPLKGHDLVVQSVGLLPEPRPRLVVVGDRGGAEPALRRRAVASGVTLDVRRGLPFAEVVELYRGAAVVACGQVREPFGLVPLEAMACARPVVAVDEGGFRETVRDGETGILVRRDPAAMAAALARVIDDAALAGRLGAAGRDDAKRRWTWDRTAAAFDDLLAGAAFAGQARKSTATS
ncbi:MAG: glycosyltransferase family 1 protein [Solirubrobacterales bacterium]|nr:glycosyltransferase family 1 protein [Solirubrobacterales bacterium]